MRTEESAEFVPKSRDFNRCEWFTFGFLAGFVTLLALNVGYCLANQDRC